VLGKEVLASALALGSKRPAQRKGKDTRKKRREEKTKHGPHKDHPRQLTEGSEKQEKNLEIASG
jgi:hypothetical protein